MISYFVGEGVESGLDLGNVRVRPDNDVVVEVHVDPEVPPDDLPDLRGQLLPPREVCEGTEELVDAELLAGDNVEDVELLGEHVLAVADEGLLVQLCSRKELSKNLASSRQTSTYRGSTC